MRSSPTGAARRLALARSRAAMSLSMDLKVSASVCFFRADIGSAAAPATASARQARRASDGIMVGWVLREATARTAKLPNQAVGGLRVTFSQSGLS